MRRYLFVSPDILPIVAFASSRDAMRAYVHGLLGLPPGMPLPRHAVVPIG